MHWCLWIWFFCLFGLLHSFFTSFSILVSGLTYIITIYIYIAVFLLILCADEGQQQCTGLNWLVREGVPVVELRVQGEWGVSKSQQSHSPGEGEWQVVVSPLLLPESGPHFKTHKSLERTKIWLWVPTRHEIRNNYVGEEQQQFTGPWLDWTDMCCPVIEVSSFWWSQQNIVIRPQIWWKKIQFPKRRIF
jgi:hypothetical protein